MNDEQSSQRLARQLAPGKATPLKTPDALWRDIQVRRSAVRRARFVSRVGQLAAAILIVVSAGTWLSRSHKPRVEPAPSVPPELTESLRVIDASLKALQDSAGSTPTPWSLEEARFLIELRGRLLTDADLSRNAGGSQ